MTAYNLEDQVFEDLQQNYTEVVQNPSGKVIVGITLLQNALQKLKDVRETGDALQISAAEERLHFVTQTVKGFAQDTVQEVFPANLPGNPLLRPRTNLSLSIAMASPKYADPKQELATVEERANGLLHILQIAKNSSFESVTDDISDVSGKVLERLEGIVEELGVRVTQTQQAASINLGERPTSVGIARLVRKFDGTYTPETVARITAATVALAIDGHQAAILEKARALHEKKDVSLSDASVVPGVLTASEEFLNVVESYWGQIQADLRKLGVGMDVTQVRELAHSKAGEALFHALQAEEIDMEALYKLADDAKHASGNPERLAQAQHAMRAHFDAQVLPLVNEFTEAYQKAAGTQKISSAPAARAMFDAIDSHYEVFEQSLLQTGYTGVGRDQWFDLYLGEVATVLNEKGVVWQATRDNGVKVKNADEEIAGQRVRISDPIYGNIKKALTFFIQNGNVAYFQDQMRDTNALGADMKFEGNWLLLNRSLQNARLFRPADAELVAQAYQVFCEKNPHFGWDKQLLPWTPEVPPVAVEAEKPLLTPKQVGEVWAVIKKGRLPEGYNTPEQWFAMADAISEELGAKRDFNSSMLRDAFHQSFKNTHYCPV